MLIISNLKGKCKQMNRIFFIIGALSAIVLITFGGCEAETQTETITITEHAEPVTQTKIVTATPSAVTVTEIATRNFL